MRWLKKPVPSANSTILLRLHACAHRAALVLLSSRQAVLLLLLLLLLLRLQYGWDPAWEQLYPPNYPATSGNSSSSSSNVTGTLAAVGRGFTICPSRTAARERLVVTPLGSDKLNACGDPNARLSATSAVKERLVVKAAGTDKPNASDDNTAYLAGASAAAATVEATTDGVSNDGVVLGSSGGSGEKEAVQQQEQQPINSSSSSRCGKISLFSLDFLAHHLPSVYFDGLMRVLGSRIDNCTKAALQLPECIVSKRCSAALRPDPMNSGKCATCASNATCRALWMGAAGGVCNAGSARRRAFLCYKEGNAVPGLFGGMLFG
jgi:hypothetical protein